ncbi:MAG: 2Fe-2S iron-sulfur cluster binding domain-containing protein [Clostridiaceae bacterium]|nr:2Fe-2S iron-sulfur cluster binding domain-containing protein [Clostridiaceae bacterium]
MDIVWAVISIALVSTGLSVIIIVADYFLNNYGDCTIDINNGSKTIVAKGGSSLLSTLASHQIFIPSACGGKATCGLCKLVVQDASGPLLPTELPYLTAQEIQAGMRLSCQIKVKKDLRILIPEELFSVREFTSTVELLEPLTHDIKLLRLKLEEPGEISFRAGQYVQLHSKPYGKIRESVFRAYSIASSPSDTQYIDLIVRLVPEGICTTYVHTALKVGDPVRINGPFGDFYLRGNKHELIMIAGGSGLAPMRSIILDVLERQLDHPIRFFFGAVTRKDLYYVEYFTELSKQHPQLTFIPALSAPGPDDQWTGEVGLITEVVARHVPDANDREAYLCGSPGMINACLKVLKDKGFSDDRILYDKF